MSTAGLINRYVWFVTTIYNRGPISLEEIQHRYELHFGHGEELSERQFHLFVFGKEMSCQFADSIDAGNFDALNLFGRQ